MIVVRAGLKIVVASQPVDLRKGINSLAALVSQALNANPYCGDVFIFRSKRMDRLKLLAWDGTGMVLMTKWLEESRFIWPPICETPCADRRPDETTFLDHSSSMPVRPCESFSVQLERKMKTSPQYGLAFNAWLTSAASEFIPFEVDSWLRCNKRSSTPAPDNDHRGTRNADRTTRNVAASTAPDGTRCSICDPQLNDARLRRQWSRRWVRRRNMLQLGLAPAPVTSQRWPAIVAFTCRRRMSRLIPYCRATSEIWLPREKF